MVTMSAEALGASEAPGESTLIVFDIFYDAMRAEHALKSAGFKFKTVAPPPQVRTGCDLALKLDFSDIGAAERELKRRDLAYTDVIFVAEGLELRPLQMRKLVKEVDYGDYLMVRCGNIKITIDKATGEIVNISGGGCPDIPYLILEMTGRIIDESPSPNELGFSLCAYTLQPAFDRAVERWRKRRKR